MIRPPQHIVDAALMVALSSPCQKSKRGVVIFERATGRMIASGTNAQPPPFSCIGSKACRDHCARLCNHAELVAIFNTTIAFPRPPFSELDVLHLKARDGECVADLDDVPKCVSCSAAIMHIGFGGVWLFESRERPTGQDFLEWIAGQLPKPVDPKNCHWVYRSAVDFHRESLANTGLPNTLKVQS